MGFGDVQHWLQQQLVDLSSRKDEELLEDPFYIEYLDVFSPHEVTHLINNFLVR